jgi:hypothetical protein
MVLRHAIALTKVELGQHTSPTFLCILSTSSSATILYLKIALTNEAMNGLTYVSDMKQLRTLNFRGHRAWFKWTYDILHWSLPHLHTLIWDTRIEEASARSIKFISKCKLPCLNNLSIKTKTTAKDTADALLVLLIKHCALTQLVLNLEEEQYAKLFAVIPASINRFGIVSPRKSIIDHIAPTIHELALIYAEKADMQPIYDVLNALSEAKRFDVQIYLTFKDTPFYWITPDSYNEDLPVKRGELLPKLLWYAAQGLQIRDDNNQTIKECFP